MKQDKRWQNTQDLTNTKHLGNINETHLGENTLHHYTIRPLHSRQKRAKTYEKAQTCPKFGHGQMHFSDSFMQLHSKSPREKQFFHQFWVRHFANKYGIFAKKQACKKVLLGQ